MTDDLLWILAAVAVLAVAVFGLRQWQAKQRRDAEAMAEAGAFAVVLEGTLEPVAAAITRSISIPTIGIGASPACDGQILVSEDVFGLFSDFTPRFVKRYADLGGKISEAAATYSADVKARRFPAMEHCFLPKSGGQSRQ